MTTRARAGLRLTLLIASMTAIACDSAAKPKAAATTSADTLAIDTVAQETNASDVYFDSVFIREIGEVPRLGWIRKGRLLAREKHARVQIFGEDSTLTDGSFARLVPPAEHREIRLKESLACMNDGTLAEYTLSRPIENKRVMYISHPFSRPVHVGFRAVPAPSAVVQAERALWRSVPAHALYSDTMIVVNGSDEYFSLHAAFDPKDKELRTVALVLHDRTGRIIASSTAAFAKDEQLCDGCGMPEYRNGVRGFYRLLNVFVLPGFAHPVLLLDTSSAESRTRTLETFSPDGEDHEYGLWEPIIICGMDRDTIHEIH